MTARRFSQATYVEFETVCEIRALKSCGSSHSKTTDVAQRPPGPFHFDGLETIHSYGLQACEPRKPSVLIGAVIHLGGSDFLNSVG
jgi:hypothetical protein